MSFQGRNVSTRTAQPYMAHYSQAFERDLVRCGCRTFSFKSASLTGRETVLGGGTGTEVSAIVDG